MKVVIRDALHARPASLLVRRASQLAADVSLRVGARTANAKDIVSVLALSAKRGDEVEIGASGEGAAEAIAALVELVTRGFDADLVPETGAVAVEGIAIGRAVLLARREPAETPGATTAPDIERMRLASALAHADAEVRALVRALPPEEAELFAPEIEILHALAPMLATRVDAGMSAEDAVRAETAAGGAATAASDLVLDAGARLVAALAGEVGEARRLLAALAALGGEDDVVLAADDLPPSIVAALPARVVGIIAGETSRGHASHAAILARGRDLPLAFVPEHVVASIAEGESVVVDTTTAPARVWIAPGGALVADARARRAARSPAADERPSLAHLGVAVRANIGSLHERLPHAAEGVGLFRTELAFADRAESPTEIEQRAAILALARRAAGEPVTVRLFDAGGDKPLDWLRPPADAPDARGIALLFAHDHVLARQLRAIAAARAAGADVRALIPLVRSAHDVEAIRARTPGVPIGAMIETPAAVDDARAIAEAADFVCIGTNDLAALALGVDRAVAAPRAIDARILDLVRRVVEAAHASKRAVTVCGEIAADEAAASALVGAGVDALSIAPARVGVVRRHLASATREECDAAWFRLGT